MLHRSNFRALRRALPLVLVATGTFLIAGCGDDDDDVDDDVSVVTGRVAGGAGNTAPTGAIEGATVTLARINASGNLETVSNASATSEADGDFRLETDLDNVRWLVVVADKGGTHLEAVVADAVQNGSAVTSPPLTVETTVEAQVWAEIVADNRTSSVSFADVSTYVTAGLAGAVNGNAATIESIATAIEVEADARNAAMVNAEYGVTASELAAINAARANALVNLYDDLAVADTQAEWNAAYEAYHTAYAQAYVSSGLSLDQAAQLSEISSRAYLNSVATLSPTVELSAARGAALARTAILQRAVLEAFTDANAPAANRTAVVNAGTTLVTSVNGAGTEAAIAAAFDAYHDTLVSQLQLVYPSRAAAIASGDAALYASLGPRETLTTAVATSTNATVLVPAYVTYFGAAEASLAAALAGASQTEIDLVTRVLLNASMAM